MGKKVRRKVYFDPEVIEYLKTCGGNISSTVNETLADAMPVHDRDEIEWETARVRERVLRIQLDSIDKEIAELERQREKLVEKLDEIEDNPQAVWEVSVPHPQRPSPVRHRKTKYDNWQDEDENEDTDE